MEDNEKISLKNYRGERKIITKTSLNYHCDGRFSVTYASPSHHRHLIRHSSITSLWFLTGFKWGILCHCSSIEFITDQWRIVFIDPTQNPKSWVLGQRFGSKIRLGRVIWVDPIGSGQLGQWVGSGQITDRIKIVKNFILTTKKLCKTSNHNCLKIKTITG